MTELIGPRRGSSSHALKITGFTILVCVLLFTEVLMVLGEEQQIKDQKAPPPHPAKKHTQLRCSNNSRQCWCVDKDGSPIKDSYTSPYQSDPDCDKFLSSHHTKPNPPDKPVLSSHHTKPNQLCKNPKSPQVPKLAVCGGTKSDTPIMSGLDDDSDNKKNNLTTM
ncbi:hypothetical protein NQD34_007637 [Periophthalmus magnuspinnatus]|nr:hypothetical protein NQD34_007637 [Periophthalmus magnuspinnatus]